MGHTSFSIHWSRIISEICAPNWAFSSPEPRHIQTDLLVTALDAVQDSRWARLKVKSKIVATMAMKSKTANKLWTSEEDERLKSLIETSISLNLVAAKLQRSISAVKNRAHVLKISVKRTSFGQRAKGK
jgi:hypothetical protein